MSNIKPFFCRAYCSKKCLLEVETVRYQCRSVRETLLKCLVDTSLRHWYRTVRTIWHQIDGAEMSCDQSVLGLKHLDNEMTSRRSVQ